MNPNFFSSIVKSKIFFVILIMVLEAVALLSAFRFGALVGFSKADFSCHWAQNYHRVFGIMPSRGVARVLDSDDYVAGNGAVGAVLSVSSSTLTVRGVDNTEKSIVVTPLTIIRFNRDSATIQDIQIDDRVTVVGAPSSTGQLEAKFIRIFRD